MALDLDTLAMLKELIVVIGSAGATYGAIRADLRSLRESVTRAHERIDEVLLKRD